MASTTQYAVQAALSRDRLMGALRLMFADAVMPQFLSSSRYGRDHVDAENWRILADWFLDKLNTKDQFIGLEHLNREDLLAEATKRGLSVKGTGQYGYVSRRDLLLALQENNGLVEEGTVEPDTSPISESED